MEIIGRTDEKQQLERILKSGQAEFVAVYGRRRVGKTYLIRSFFEKKNCIFFRTSGVHNGSLKQQLENFKNEIESCFYGNRQGSSLATFNNWHDAFAALSDAIKLFGDKKKIVIFLDELPWMATQKSGLIEALDYYWNRYWSENPKIKVIICGSAASWIIENILEDKGGLHNRVTLRICLNPFNLAETKAYLQYKKINYNHDQILTIYMCIGGIPFYLNFIEKGLSAIQNINNICFNKKGTLYDEFDLVFASLFSKDEIHKDIIAFIASRRYGVSRTDIEDKFYKGGRLTSKLKELEEAGFIASFIPWQKERGIYYRVIDEYSIFYLTWIAPRSKSRISKTIDEKYWEIISQKSSWKSWAGYAFESICFKHISQIKKALNIPEGSDVSSWRYVSESDQESGAQIDLVFDRPDNTINLCEIKYNSTPFVIDKNYAILLKERANLYQRVHKTNKQIFHSMIVANGIKKNMYSEELIDSVVTLKDLFN
jgi:AAA+ ATPase superfamily predicted ATPase